jgi:hypothetical protein
VINVALPLALLCRQLRIVTAPHLILHRYLQHTDWWISTRSSGLLDSDLPPFTIHHHIATLSGINIATSGAIIALRQAFYLRIISCGAYNQASIPRELYCYHATFLLLLLLLRACEAIDHHRPHGPLLTTTTTHHLTPTSPTKTNSATTTTGVFCEMGGAIDGT